MKSLETNGPVFGELITELGQVKIVDNETLDIARKFLDIIETKLNAKLEKEGKELGEKKERPEPTHKHPKEIVHHAIKKYDESRSVAKVIDHINATFGVKVSRPTIYYWIKNRDKLMPEQPEIQPETPEEPEQEGTLSSFPRSKREGDRVLCAKIGSPVSFNDYCRSCPSRISHGDDHVYCDI